MEPNLLNVSSVTGAVIGALSTQMFLILKENFAYKRRQIRAVNGALAATAAVCDAVLQLKVQHINGIRSFIDTENERIDELLVRREEIGDVDVIHIDIEYLHLPKIWPPIDELSTVLHKHLDVTGAALLYFYAIVRSFTLLEATIENYNRLVEESMRNDAAAHKETAFRFLGRRLDSGYVDTRNSDFIEQMDVAIRSCAAYAYLLSEVLSRRGNTLKNSFLFRKPKVDKLDFSVYKRSGDFPEEEYLARLRKH